MYEKVREIAARVRELREIEGLSAESLAGELSLDAAVWKNYESGEADIPVGVLFEIAGRFKVDLAELVTGEAPRLKTYCLTRADRGPEVARRTPYKYRGRVSS
ncbi:MAG: hypothetical protein A2Z99_16510 [Treponema sp. GWB1_62_6]|nr:MAG: hypothetical protein A2Z99_16510 [Treponema sp. GWB1_62_6]HCM27739.1 hypothetical protein [Treponema sp.]